MSQTPFISIVTVVFDSENLLEDTIQSIINQSLNDFEYIIIDGGSTDGTVGIIKKYSHKISKWISEPDSGLYDAMNKGIQLATGKYIWFINSGDKIYSHNTIELLAEQLSGTEPNLIYGETMIIGSNNEKIGMRRHKAPATLSWKSFKYGMLVSHQSMIAKLSVVPLFDYKYKYSADYDWALKILRKKGTILNSHLILSRFLAGGQTNKTIMPGLKERFKIMVKNYGFVSTLFFHIPIVFRFLFFFVKNKRFLFLFFYFIHYLYILELHY